MNKVYSFRDHELIKVITGIRRCGKSYMFNLIIQELIKKGVSRDNIILLNFNEAPYNHVDNSRELDLIVNDLIKDSTGKIYLFFDEIQNVIGWEKSITAYNAAYNCDIYIAGSNSKILSEELATHLTGRYIQIKMYPFSFKEFVEYNGNNSNSIEELFEEYIVYGGIPVVSSLDDEYKQEYLFDLYSSILFNDIVSRYNLRDVSILKRLVEFLMDNMAGQFSVSDIIDYFQKENIKISRKTVYNYLDYLQEVYLIYKAEKYDLKGKYMLKNHEKYYVADHGFSQAILGRNKRNMGRILENIVYIELLRRGYEVSIGKIGDDLEVDFVCRKGDKICYIQVSYQLANEETIEREFKPLLEIRDNYPKYVISMDKIDFSHDGIIHLNIIDFLLENKKIRFENSY